MTGFKWFSQSILTWYAAAKRPLPWRESTDPYIIWLSEIILQQTRVEQGMAYFLRFSSLYPKVHDLANAPEDEVMKNWEGLGYYSRARNLHATAKFVSAELNGVFPSSYKELIRLKGIGPYTAAAIASIAANEPVAVVDGNVYRLLSRVFGIHTAIDSTQGQKEFKALANELLNPEQAGEFNQAMMEFGAIQCTPRNPQCNTCIFQEKCIALNDHSIEKLPFKKGKTKVRKRYFDFIRFQMDANTILEKRNQKDIWQGLYQFPLIESDAFPTRAQLEEKVSKEAGAQIKLNIMQEPTVHVLSHQRIHARLWQTEVKAGYRWSDDQIVLATEDLNDYALPRVLTRWLET